MRSLLIMPVLSLLWMPFALLFAAEMSLYTLLDVLFSIKLAISMRNDNRIAAAASLFILFPVFHVCYGFGSLMGLFNLCTKKFRREMLHKKAAKQTEKQKETVGSAK